MQRDEFPTVTASEVAEFVFCRHAWYLSRLKVLPSVGQRSLMAAGVEAQRQKDRELLEVVECGAALKKRAMNAWRAVWILSALALLVGFVWLLRRLSL